MAEIKMGLKEAPGTRVGPSLTPVSGEEEAALPNLSKMVQKMIKDNPELVKRASSTARPGAMIPPNMAMGSGLLPQIPAPTQEEILRSILGSLGGTFDLTKRF
jgi:hypothetical protein